MIKGSADPFLFDTKKCGRFLFVARNQKQAAAKQTFVFLGGYTQKDTSREATAYAKRMVFVSETGRRLDFRKEKTMQMTRLQKQHMNMLSSLPMGLDFVRENSGYGLGFQCPGYTTRKNMEGKYETWIRQPRCRNGG